MASVSRTTTIYGSGADRIDLIFTAQEVQVLPDTNQSRVKVYMTLEFHGTYCIGTQYISEAFVSVDGVKVGRRTSGYSAQNYFEGGQWRVIDGATTTVTHNDDGTKSVTCYGSYNGRTTSSATLTLSTIKLTGTGSFSPNPAIIATENGTTAMTLTVTPRNPDYFHYVKISTGGLAYITQAWAEDNSNTFAVTDLNILSNSVNMNRASGNVYALIETYDAKDILSANLIGSVTIYGPWIIDTSAIRPDIVIDTIAPVTTSIPNVIVAGYSTVRIGLLNLPPLGTTVTAQLNRGTVASADRSAVITNTLPASDTDYTVTATINARDGRGATDQEQTTFTVKGYKRPIAKLTAYRVASNGSTTYDEAGTYVYVNKSNTITALGTNAVQSESLTYAGDISGTINSTPAWIALTEQQGATFTYTVTDLVATGTATVSVPVAIFPLDLFQSGASVGAAFGGVAVGGLVRSFLPLAAQLPVVTEDTNASSTLDSRSGIVTRAHYNGAQTFTIPTGTSSGWYAIIVRSRDNSTTFTCGGSDGLIIAGASSIPTTKTISGLGTYILIRVAGTRLALFYDQNSGGGGGGGSTDWSDLTNVPLVTTISSASTDSQFPSAKCVYDQIGDIETLLQALR